MARYAAAQIRKKYGVKRLSTEIRPKSFSTAIFLNVRWRTEHRQQTVYK
jgi:hypothetical protein